MKFNTTLLLLIFLNLTAAVAQVKIGDNPNQIDANSLLELESSNKVLVLSRVSTTQMNAITPLNGALVYNTDQDCVYQYTGSTWESLCSIIETTTLLLDNNDGTFSYTNEAGTTVNINKAFLTNNGDGTFTFDNGNGSPVNFVGTDSQTAVQVAFDDTASTLGATDVQGAIDALAASNAADGDTNSTNEIQNINQVLTVDNNAGGLVIDNIGAPIDGNDATNKTYVDTAITAAAADGSETIVTAGTDISVTGTGTTANPYIVNSTFTEVDGSTTNEIQNSAQVNLSTPLDVDGDTVNETTVQEAIADLSTAVAADGDTDATNEIQNINEVLADGNNAGGLVIDNIGAPIDGNDAANKNYVDTAITAAAADGSETIVTAGTDISVTGTGTTANPYIVNSTFTEVDGSTSNEIQN
ncbi:hypothetical protein, partial [Aquimarina intermedia]